MVPLHLLIIIVRFEGSMLFEKGIPTCYYHQFSTCLFECMAKIFCYSIRPKMDDVFLFFTNLFMYMSKLFHLYSDGIDSILLFSGFRKIELNSLQRAKQIFLYYVFGFIWLDRLDVNHHSVNRFQIVYR